MTKKEFIERMKDMPDTAEVYFWNTNMQIWQSGATPIYFSSDYIDGSDENGEFISNFIGIE